MEKWERMPKLEVLYGREEVLLFHRKGNEKINVDIFEFFATNMSLSTINLLFAFLFRLL